MGNSTRRNYTAFVPNGDSRRDTAIILVGTAEQHGIDQRSIRATLGGFDITDELADVLYADDVDEDIDEITEPEPEPEPKPAPAKPKGKATKTPDAAPAATAKKNKE